MAKKFHLGLFSSPPVMHHTVGGWKHPRYTALLDKPAVAPDRESARYLIIGDYLLNGAPPPITGWT